MRKRAESSLGSSTSLALSPRSSTRSRSAPLGADINTMQNSAGIYGTPPAEVLDSPVNAIQFSPLMPGASALELQGEGSLAAMTMLAPPGTLERRYAIALALRAMAPSGSFSAQRQRYGIT